jgi:hypothetical protein
VRAEGHRLQVHKTAYRIGKKIGQGGFGVIHLGKRAAAWLLWVPLHTRAASPASRLWQRHTRAAPKASSPRLYARRRHASLSPPFIFREAGLTRCGGGGGAGCVCVGADPRSEARAWVCFARANALPMRASPTGTARVGGWARAGALCLRRTLPADRHAVAGLVAWAKKRKLAHLPLAVMHACVTEEVWEPFSPSPAWWCC